MEIVVHGICLFIKVFFNKIKQNNFFFSFFIFSQKYFKKEDGTLEGCGDNNYGQLGTGDNEETM